MKALKIKLGARMEIIYLGDRQNVFLQDFKTNFARPDGNEKCRRRKYFKLQDENVFCGGESFYK